MPADENVARVTAEWVQKAESDLRAAALILKRGRGCPTDTVCFHAQQCVEKYLKAILVYNSVAFPKTHDLEHLVELLPVENHVWLAPDEQRDLTNYAAAARYPGWPAIPLKEAREAVRIARRVRAEARRALPRAALRLPRPKRRR